MKKENNSTPFSLPFVFVPVGRIWRSIFGGPPGFTRLGKRFKMKARTPK